ncbi:MAG: helix-turn-helix domain-containing protein [Treponema sp.]|jgi:transcriptional regulator with XRE-family HTH domain|nr:helix-turn-helix domain-containing protein [Treponema sp.]
MGFKENLKAQLKYADMLVKELAALSGIKKQTIDSYLRECGYTPSVDAAVKIAQVLGVSVEYLVTGHEMSREKKFAYLTPEIRSAIQIIEQLDENDRTIALALLKTLKTHQDAVKHRK